MTESENEQRTESENARTKTSDDPRSRAPEGPAAARRGPRTTAMPCAPAAWARLSCSRSASLASEPAASPIAACRWRVESLRSSLPVTLVRSSIDPFAPRTSSSRSMAQWIISLRWPRDEGPIPSRITTTQSSSSSSRQVLSRSSRGAKRTCPAGDVFDRAVPRSCAQA